MKSSTWVSSVIVAAVLVAASGCSDGNTLTGPDSRATAPAASAGSSNSPSASDSDSPARTVLRPGSRGRTPILVGQRPTAVPSGALSGTWTGTMNFYASPEGGPQPCEKATSITVDLWQSGESLTGQFTAGCHGTLALHGTLSNGQFSGTVADPSGPIDKLSGSASSDRIQFRALRELINDDGDDSFDDYYTSTRVDLSR